MLLHFSKNLASTLNGTFLSNAFDDEDKEEVEDEDVDVVVSVVLVAIMLEGVW